MNSLVFTAGTQINKRVELACLFSSQWIVKYTAD